MYRVAICDDEPHAAEQNEAKLCHILEDRNLKRDIDYSIHCFSSPVPLLAQMEKRPPAPLPAQTSRPRKAGKGN